MSAASFEVSDVGAAAAGMGMSRLNEIGAKAAARQQYDTCPYPVALKPVLGERMVIASQPLAAQAGLRMLEQGGNAVDAAIAAAATIAVVEPTNNGIGGDAYAIVRRGDRLYGLNATGRASLRADLAEMRARHGENMPQRGWDSVTTPGAVSAWAALSARHGSLPFAELLGPALHYAQHGFRVTPGVARKWAEQAKVLGGEAEFRRVFLPGGAAPQAGALFAQPELAETLQRIAASGGADLYTGRSAQLLAAHAAACGATLSQDDLAAHRADWTDVLRGPYRDATLYEMPPNGLGVVALYALAILDRLDVDRHPADSAPSLHLQIEALKRAFARLGNRVGDPRNMDMGVDALMSQEYVEEDAGRIDPLVAADPGRILPAMSGTVYLAAGDASGMMVSFIQSNYMGFGSGVVVPGTGIALQNRGACFSLDPRSPARLAPGVRPLHTILPGFLELADGSAAAFGATGGIFQPQGHVQLAVRLAAYGQHPQAVVDAPRFKVGNGRRVVLEPGFRQDTARALADLGHEITEQQTSTWDFGGMQILLRRSDGCYVGARDVRRDSHVAVC
ncbi:gamma-glutamyltransferase family protein [Candidimonas humi]|uniref:Gamma-glutamyltransferase family protein n=1 Tax=Candidimonas humi TaxID=683355 RepID=A0ABV8P5P6_9BURK|nr:gamma-glutamyltransferase family protein [Candidimonas humi]